MESSAAQTQICFQKRVKVLIITFVYQNNYQQLVASNNIVNLNLIYLIVFILLLHHLSCDLCRILYKLFTYNSCIIVCTRKLNIPCNCTLVGYLNVHCRNMYVIQVDMMHSFCHNYNLYTGVQAQACFSSLQCLMYDMNTFIYTKIPV